VKAPKRTCCRSLPRCADCPVLLVARRERVPRAPTTASLVDEVLRGRDPRPLPSAVLDALAGIDNAHEASRSAV
jgi:hypothetical protein